MAKLRELIIKISANSSSFQSEIARASRMGENYYRTLEQGGRKAAMASRETKRAIGELNNELSSIKSTVTGVMGAMAGAFATQQLIGYADAWSQLSGRLKLASVSAEDFSRAQQELMSLSQRTGTSLAANTNLYARIAQSMRDAGYASGDVAKVTETIATSLILSGASAAEASSVTTQLSQALASGVLRGEEFNSVMENGGRLARLLAAGMGTTIGGLREMAQSGQLTTDKIVPILTNTEQLRKEFEQLPQTVSMASQKVENAFMAWVGGANEASGATSSLTGALNGIAGNIDSIATVAGALIGVGLARYFGGLTTSVARATIGVANAAKGEVALAHAQVRGTQVAVARARAAEYRAQKSLAAARGTDTQAGAEKRLAAVQASVARNVNARTIAQNNLNNVTSVGSRLLGGALGLVGGIPGLVMLGAGAWYTMYQRQEQARQSAREYAATIDQVLINLSKMTLPETSDNFGKTKKSLAEINRLIDEQQQKVNRAQRDVDALNDARANPAYSGTLDDSDLVGGLAKATANLAVEQGALNDLNKKSEEIQSALKAVESQRDFLIRQQVWSQNNMRDSLLLVNAEHTEFNRIMSAGNQILTNRQALVSSPMRIPAAALSDKQQDFIQKSERDKELSGLTGEARIIRQAEFAADDQNLTEANGHRDNRQVYIDNQVSAYQNQQKLSEALKAGKSAQSAYNKEQKDAERQAEQYTRKIADLSVATEVQKVRATQGEKAADLYAASHESGAKWTDEQSKAIRQSSVALAEWTQKADEAVRKQREMDDALKAMRDGARKFSDEADQIDETRGMGSLDRSYYDERQQIDRIYEKSDKKSEATEARKQEINALDLKYKNLREAQSDWMSGMSSGMKDWVAESGNYAEQTASAVQSAMGGMVNNITDMLNGNKTSWRDWSVDVLKSIQKILVNAAIVNSIKSMSGAGGWIGAVGDFLGGATPHAKGGVYDSPGLSAYSNQVVSSPTYFAFAKGAGLMGEAGPEAIMPLTRAADGSLGVRSLGGSQSSGSSAPQVFITIDGNGNSQARSSAGYEQFGNEIANFVDQRYRILRDKDIRPGGEIWNIAKGKR